MPKSRLNQVLSFNLTCTHRTHTVCILKGNEIKVFLLHRDSSFCFMIYRRGTVFLRQRHKYLQFFHTERYFKSWTHQEKKNSYKKKMMNATTGTSANNTSSSYTPYSVPSRVEGIALSVVFLLEAVLH